MRYLLDKRFLIAIWIAIFLMKLSIGVAHMINARKCTSPALIDISKGAYELAAPETRKDFDRFASAVNEAFCSYLTNARREHFVAAGGYLVAALTSFLSVMLELRSILWGQGAKGPATLFGKRKLIFKGL